MFAAFMLRSMYHRPANTCRISFYDTLFPHYIYQQHCSVAPNQCESSLHNTFFPSLPLALSFSLFSFLFPPSSPLYLPLRLPPPPSLSLSTSNDNFHLLTSPSLDVCPIFKTFFSANSLSVPPLLFFLSHPLSVSLLFIMEFLRFT